MKKFFLLFTILVTFTYLGCDKKSGNDNKPVSLKDTVQHVTKVDPNPPASVKLAYAFKKGDTFNYKIVSTNKSTQTIKSDTTVSQSGYDQIRYLINFSVVEVDEDKTADLKVILSTIEIDANSGDTKVSYKSGTITDSTERLKYADYEALVNSPFNIRVNSKGELLEITKVDRITNKLLDMQGAKDKVNEEQKKQIGFNISEGALKPLLKQIFRNLPSTELAKDSTWNESTPSKFSIFDAVTIAQYELQEFEKLNDERLAIISFDANIETKGQNTFTERGVKYNFSKPKANGNGKIKFNTEKGLIQSSMVKSTVKSSMKMELPPNAPGPKFAERSDDVVSENQVTLL